MKEMTFPKFPGLKRKYVLFAASLLNYSFLSQSDLVLSEPAGQCGWLAFSMQKFFPGGKEDDHRKMQIRHTKVCQSALETREEVFIAGITFSLTVGRLLPRGSFLDGQARGFSLPKANTV